MTDYLSNPPKQTSYEDQYKALSEEKGVSGLQENVGTYKEEVDKTLGLLGDLRKNIKERTGAFLVPESARARIEASERQPLTEELATLQRGETLAENKLSTAKSDILNILSIREKDTGQKMTELKDLMGIVSDYEKMNTPNLDTSVTEVTGSDGKPHKVIVNNQTGATVKDLGLAPSALTSDTSEQKILDNFQKDVSDYDLIYKYGSREQFIRPLQAKYPQIDKNDINDKVYEVWPNNSITF
jgi:hypothetical protein